MKTLAGILFLLVTACGEGGVIVNIDVLSFLGAGDSTQQYDVPGGVGGGYLTISRHVALPSIGHSTVDSVSGTFASQLENETGSGNVTLQVFFSQTLDSLYTGAPSFTDSSDHVWGVDTVSMGTNNVWLEESVFRGDSMWVGVRARFDTDSGPNMTGLLRLTDLRLRVVLQDKVL